MTALKPTFKYENKRTVSRYGVSTFDLLERTQAAGIDECSTDFWTRFCFERTPLSARPPFGS